MGHVTKLVGSAASVYPGTGIGATAAGDTYVLSAHYFDVSLTKQDPSTGAVVTLTQTVFPVSAFSFPVN
jgi:hypothetical protein